MATHISEIVLHRPSHIGKNGDMWVLRNLRDFTIVFGKNGSGKSLLLRQLNAERRTNSHYINPERIGDISYEAGLTQRWAQGVGERANMRSQNAAHDYRQQVVSRIQNMYSQAGYQAGRSEPIMIDWDEAEHLISLVLPDFAVALKSAAPFIELSRSSTGEKVTSVQQLSSGEAEALCIALDVLTVCYIWETEKQSDRLLLVDEPDAHLHATLQQQLASFLIQACQRFNVQLIIATHSVPLFAAFGALGGNRTGVVYLSRETLEYEAQPFRDKMKSLLVALGGHSFLSSVFDIPLLLVEGPDDLEVWSQIPRSPRHKHAFSVVECGGGYILETQARLETIFASLKDTGSPLSGYALLDGDQSVPSVPQKHIKFLRLSCRESENLYLTDEVLEDMGMNWEEAKEKIKAYASENRNSPGRLTECDKWERKDVDLKNGIETLAQILDKKHKNWRRRLGKVLASTTPRGQIREFLGEQIVEAFWSEQDVKTLTEALHP